MILINLLNYEINSDFEEKILTLAKDYKKEDWMNQFNLHII
jgi:hypothetical protein